MAGWRARAGSVRFAIAAIAAAVLGAQSSAQSQDLSAVNEAHDWAAGCGTDEFGINFCAVQKSNGPQALGYVMQQREDGIARQIRISANTMFIDAEGPVTIQVDDNEPLVWNIGFKLLNNQVISLDGQSINELLLELETGQTVTVTLTQKTGEQVSFELELDGFTEAIAALEQTSADVAN